MNPGREIVRKSPVRPSNRIADDGASEPIRRPRKVLKDIYNLILKERKKIPVSLRINGIRLELDEAEESLPAKLAARLGVSAGEIARWRILRKSLDARKRDEIHFVYSVEVESPDLEASLIARGATAGVESFEPERFDWPEPGEIPLRHRPLIVGSGPAGLFAGYFLALSGYRPLILERGRSVKDRAADVRAFDRGGELDPESNYLFGEGGAGTFSDGKLTTRAGGPDVRRVLEVLAECHGKSSILYEHRPHLGSNRLPLIVRTLRRKIEELGGEIRFSRRVEDLEIENGRLVGVFASSERIACDATVLAIGHSARDTYEMLFSRGVPIVPKAFQLGARIEQPQEQINRARHGRFAGSEALGAADYELTAKAGDRDLFTFCMCAGGFVMPSVSEPEHYCTNGMSESRHDSPFANSGLVVTIRPNDLESDHPLAGVRFQRECERLAFLSGNGSYHAPVQWVRDFLADRPSQGILPSSHVRGSFASDLRLFLPTIVTEALKRGLPVLDRRLRGLFLENATLTGPESRGSSPVRIPRDDLTRESIGLTGLYPCGEGAGYAGGIVSAAVDGLRTARVIVRRFAPAS